MPFLVIPPGTPTYFPIICPPLFPSLFRLWSLCLPPFGTATSIRTQIDRILAFPSLLGVARCADTRRPSLSPDIDDDNHNAVPTRGDGEDCHAVNDLQPGCPLVDSPGPMPEANRFPFRSPMQTRNQMPAWQHTRHLLHPSDPTPAVINCADLDRDHRQHHQLPPLPIHSRANSTGGDLPSSPSQKHDRNRDGGYCEVSCLVAGLYTRCSAFDSVRGYIHVGTWVLASVDCICFVQYAALP